MALLQDAQRGITTSDSCSSLKTLLVIVELPIRLGKFRKSVPKLFIEKITLQLPSIAIVVLARQRMTVRWKRADSEVVPFPVSLTLYNLPAGHGLAIGTLQIEAGAVCFHVDPACRACVQRS